jgi:hypothetical protein
VIGGSPGTAIGGIVIGGTVIGGISIGGCGPGTLPRLWQVPLWQLVPVWVQLLFAQQGCPAAPQVTHCPLWQTALA